MEEIIRTGNIDTSKAYRGIVITDLDGTLLDSDKNLKDKDHETLLRLKDLGFLRVLATGRHLYSLFHTIGTGFPVDYIIFSSGAGIWNNNRKREQQPESETGLEKTDDYVRIITMEPGEVEKAASVFCNLALDFAIHKPIPDNHYFSYYCNSDNNHDFNRRIIHYRPYASRGKELPPKPQRASQLLSIITSNVHSGIYDQVHKKLPGYTVIRTTSPLDHTSMWIEVFPRTVSKGRTSSWLASQFRLNSEYALATGNDYNDLDLLSWAKTSFLVSNGPDELKKMYPSVASHNECGFSEAVERWFGIMGFV